MKKSYELSKEVNEKKIYNKKYFYRQNKNLFNHFFIELHHQRRPALKYLEKHLPQNSTLLDVGCGIGNFLYHARKYFQCTGCDLASEALKVAEKRLSDVQFFHYSAYELDRFQPKKFDAITSFDVVEHLLDHPNVFKTILALLKDDGYFVFCTPNYNCISREIKQKKWFGFSDPTHLVFYSYEEWSHLLKEAGFVVIKTFGEGLMDPPYTRWLPYEVERFVIKYLTQGLALLSFPLPRSLHEVTYFVCIKNPGLSSESYYLQQQILKKSK